MENQGNAKLSDRIDRLSREINSLRWEVRIGRLFIIFLLLMPGMALSILGIAAGAFVLAAVIVGLKKNA